MKPTACWAALAGLMTCFTTAVQVAGAEGGYCIVVSKSTHDDPQWKPVVDALVAKHQGTVITFQKAVEDSLAGLQKGLPRYVCFVAKPSEATREFVTEVNRLTRRMSDAPYTGAVWGILTGYDAACAVRIARHKEPLVIRRVAAGTEVELRMCDEGLWYCELNQGKMVRKESGGKPEQQKCPADTTKALVEALNVYQPQLFVTSGHATERDWQIGFRYRNGQFRSHAGELFGLDTRGERFPVHSDNPKVYLPVGNCLMGHIDGPDAMALAYMNCAGVYQMAGYTVPTWYGYARLGPARLLPRTTGPFHAGGGLLRQSAGPDPPPGDVFPRQCGAGGYRAAGQSRVAAAGPPGGFELERRCRDCCTTATTWPSTAIRPGQPAWPPVRSAGSRRSARRAASIVSRSGRCAASGVSRPSTPTARSVAAGRSSNSCRTTSRPVAFRSWKAPI